MKELKLKKKYIPEKCSNFFFVRHPTYGEIEVKHPVEGFNARGWEYSEPKKGDYNIVHPAPFGRKLKKMVAVSVECKSNGQYAIDNSIEKIIVE